MIPWDWLGFVGGYVTIGSVALYLQFKSNIAALDRMTAAHAANVKDLKMMIEVLQLALMHQQDIAGQGRPTHAELEL